MYHLLYRASLDGLVVRGPMVGGKHAYVLVRDWLGEPDPVDRDEALPEFARRYLAGHGPATIATWLGGRASRCATCAPDFRRSPASSRSSATASWT